MAETNPITVCSPLIQTERTLSISSVLSEPSSPRCSGTRTLHTDAAGKGRRFSYDSIPEHPKAPRHPSFRLIPARRIRAFFDPVTLITVCLFVLACIIAWDASPLGHCQVKTTCRILGVRERIEEVWWRNSGAYAPWRSLGPGGGDRGLPRGCSIDQVIILQRHSARYPTSTASHCMKEALAKLANRAERAPKPRNLQFLAQADLTMQGWRFEELLDSGRRQAWHAGSQTAALYKGIFDPVQKPFTRSAGSARVVETAGYWLEGFRGQPFDLQHDSDLPSVNLTLPEKETFNNTLSAHNCPAATRDPPKHYPELLSLLQPAIDRLNRELKPKPTLEVGDLTCLADMCAYDSQRSESWRGWSKWCGILERDEWEIIGHWKDVDRYYGAGQGGNFGATLGAGWTNELIARLTDSAPSDATSTNRTLDADESTFPRGGNRLFVDFTHDNEMIEIMTAMGLVKQHQDPPTTHVPRKRRYVISELIPFGSRMIFERIQCGEDQLDIGVGPRDPKTFHAKHLRVFINDAPTQLDSGDCRMSQYAEYGMCDIDSFVASQSWAQHRVDWNVCYKESVMTQFDHISSVL